MRVEDNVEKVTATVEVITEDKGSSLFLFADQASLAASNPLDLEWMSGKSAMVTLSA